MTTSSTLVCLPVSIPLSAVSLAGASISCVAMVLTKKYQRNSRKSRIKLVNIVISALAVFETSVSKVLKDGKIDKQEFDMIQKLYYKLLNDLSMSTKRWNLKLDLNCKKLYGKK